MKRLFLLSNQKVLLISLSTGENDILPYIITLLMVDIEGNTVMVIGVFSQTITLCI